MIKKILTVSAVLLLLSSCGEQSEKVEPLKRSDKQLNCGDIQLEINEADMYKKQAMEKKQLGIKSIVMPLGYIDTYMSADEAIQAADARVQYLTRISDIKHCDADGTSSNTNSSTNLQPVGYAMPGSGVPEGIYGTPVYGSYPPSR